MNFVYCMDMENKEEMFLQRDLVEKPEYWLAGARKVRQIIPYVVVKNAEGKIATFQRMKGDKRLMNEITIGTGGHIEPTDVYGSRSDILFSAAAREIEEELGVTSVTVLSQTNITICSNATPVDSVHFGVVFVAELGTQLVCQDGELEFMGWKTFDELDKMKMESWSTLIRKDLKKWMSVKS